MINDALEYSKAVNLITQDHLNGLHKLELKEVEWHFAVQLCELLKVHFYSEVSLLVFPHFDLCRSPGTLHSSSLEEHLACPW